MIDDNFRCDAIAMTRAIKDKLDEEFATMKLGEISQYLEKSAQEFQKYLAQGDDKLKREKAK
jgi:3'-phosphoadenosine 5'-phosphosulfate sulfotransferase (PAPS reductase)/FAD synthetase